MAIIHSRLTCLLFFFVVIVAGSCQVKPTGELYELELLPVRPPEMREAAYRDALEESFSALQVRLGLLGCKVHFLGFEGDKVLIRFTSSKEYFDLFPDIIQQGRLIISETYAFGDGYKELIRLNELVKGAIQKDSTLLKQVLEVDYLQGEGAEQLAQRKKFITDFPFFIDFIFPQQAQLEAYTQTPVLGYMNEDDKWKLSFWMQHPEIYPFLNPELYFYWGRPFNGGEDIPGNIPVFDTKIAPWYFPLLAIKPVNGGPGAINEEMLDYVRLEETDEGDHALSLYFGIDGTAIFKRMTTENLGKSLAVLVDNEVLYYPKVEGIISDGRVLVQGDFSQTDLQILTASLNAYMPLEFGIAEP